MTPREGARIVDSVVKEGERDVVNGKVEGGVLVGEGDDLVGTVVVVVIGAVIVWESGRRGGNARSREIKRRGRDGRSNGSREGGGGAHQEEGHSRSRG